MVHLVLLLVHGINPSPGPELQQSLKQKASQVHCGRQISHESTNITLKTEKDMDLHFGSDPSELEKPASFADTQAAKQSLSSKVIVSI